MIIQETIVQKKAFRNPLSIKYDSGVWKRLCNWSKLCTRAYNFSAKLNLDNDKRYHEGDKNAKILSFPEANRLLTEFKEKNPDLYQAQSHSLQYSVQEASIGAGTCIKKRCAGQKARMPKLRPEYCCSSVYVPECRFSLEHVGGKVAYLHTVLNKEKLRLRIVMVYPPEGKMKAVVLSRMPSTIKWYVTFVCEVELPSIQQAGPDVGIDLNVLPENMIVVADKEHEISRYRFPDSVEEMRKKIDDLQRIKSGILNRNGHNYKSRSVKKIKTRLRRLYAHLRNLRQNSLHHISKEIVKTSGRIGLEDLDLKKMTTRKKAKKDSPVDGSVKRKTKLNRKMLNSSHGTFRNMLIFKSHEAGVRVYKYNPAYSSKKCSHCSTANSRVMGKREGRMFTCLGCGRVFDADTNAAINHAKDAFVRGQQVKPKVHVSLDQKRKNKRKKKLANLVDDEAVSC